ncbi:MAG: hypothetical protein ACQES9_12785 [Myxococcota bacterium]
MKKLMDNTSTMDLDAIIRKSLYLQNLFLQMPEKSLEEVLPAPRGEFIRDLKEKLQVVGDC